MSKLEFDFETARVVYIEWMDSFGGGGWQRTSGAHETDLVCKSIGWLIEEDDKVVTIGHSVSTRNNVIDPISIPLCCITKYEELVL